MLKKICRGAFAVVLLLTLICGAASAHTAVIENGGANKYKAIRLTPEIYNNAKGDLSDLRIQDGKNEEIPYFINSGNQTDYNIETQTYPMTLINSYTKDDSFYFDYKISDVPERDIIATSIELTTSNTGFAKNIELYGSYDDINWELVQNDTLYSIDGKSKLNIKFLKAQKYTHYRFKLGNNLEKISFGSATLIYNNVTQENIYFIENIIPEFNVTEEIKSTAVHINGLYHLKLAGITVDTDSSFMRTVTAPYAGNKELYNLSLNGTSYNDTTIPYNGQIVNDSDFSLIINNGDDKPINIKGIAAQYYADELVFEDNGSETYTLTFGADAAASAPVYDISKYKDEILKGGIDKLEIKNITFAEPEKEPKQDYTMIFNIVIVAVAILLGVLILFKLRKKSQ